MYHDDCVSSTLVQLEWRGLVKDTTVEGVQRGVEWSVPSLKIQSVLRFSTGLRRFPLPPELDPVPVGGRKDGE